MKERRTFYLQYGKRAFDAAGAAVLLFLFSWLFLLLAAAIKCTSKGPVIFSQKRIGKRKTTFLLYKFRTMRMDTPKDVPTHLLKNPEQFITPIGKFLRRFSLDELPQLFNILRGDMSFVGPRPALWNQEDLLWERDKYGANNCIPGLTGWAQVNGRDELSIAEKAAFDGEYVRRAGLFFDIRILCRTFFKVAEHDGVKEGGPGAQALEEISELAAAKEECAAVRVLLIGAHSYIGGKLAEHQKKEGTGIQMDTVSASDGAWKKKDFSGYDSVVMLAALVHRKEKQSQAAKYDQVNCELAVEAAEKAKRAGVRQFVFFSTMAVYGSRAEEITHDTVPAPDTLYGRSKYKAERLLGELESPEFAVAILRPPMVYGPECPGNYRKLEKAAAYLPLFPDTGNRRSMIEVTRLCREVTAIIWNGQSGIFLPQDEEYHNTAEMVKEMRKRDGKRTYVTHAFSKSLRLLAKKNRMFRKIFGSQYYQ